MGEFYRYGDSYRIRWPVEMMACLSEREGPTE